MAINISDKYPGRSNPPSVDYPQGSIKNQTAPGARDGTPLDEAWANDKEGFFQSILTARGITANGEVDRVGASQYYDALAADPTETLRGMPLLATTAQAQALTDDARMLTPKKLADAFGGASQLLGNNGYKIFPGPNGQKYIEQWGRSGPHSGQLPVTVTLPMAFPNEIFHVSATLDLSSGLGGMVSVLAARISGSLSQIQTAVDLGTDGDSGTPRYVYWRAIGR